MKIMNNETAGQAIFIIKVDDSQAVKQLGQWQNNLSKTMDEGKQSTRSLSQGFDDLASSVAQLATAGAAFTGLSSGISSVVESYNQYEAAMNGVKAVASATGNDVAESISSIKEITSGGLISQEDAARSIKNLQLLGFSIEEATKTIGVLTDAAVYNRQTNYTVSEAVAVTTDGFRTYNSTLSDAAGIQKNIAKMFEDYGKQLGKNANDLTKAEQKQAILNGVMEEGSIFAGNAESYTNTLAGSQQKLDTALQGAKQTMGAMFSTFSPIIGGLAQWVTENQELVAWVGTFVGVLAGGAGLVAAIKLSASAIGVMNGALTTLVGTSIAAKLGVIGLVGGLAALVAGVLVGSGSSALEDTSEAAQGLAENTNQASVGVTNLGNSADDTAKKIAKLEKQLSDLDRDYARDLKQIAVKHEESLATLTQQIEEANADYRRAIEERNAEFNVTLAKQERSHQETVDELMTQLNFLQRYNNNYNKQKLLQVQLALADEERLYKAETEAQQAEIDLQNAADKQKLDDKLASLEKELADERAFMAKHRDDLNSVQDLILNDEIESLKERYEAQKASYQEQIVEAKVSGNEIGAGLSQSIQNAMNGSNFGDVGKNWGNQIVDGIMERLGAGFKKVDTFVRDNLSGWLVLNKGTKETGNFWEDTRKSLFGFSDGGYTGRGTANEVAGVVHRGEYVIPARNVDQSTGQPKVGNTNYYNISLSGVLATSASAKRELAQEIVKAIEQTNQSRLTNKVSIT